MIRRSIGLGVISASIAILLFAIPTQAQQSPVVMATVQESAPVPADQIPQAIKDSVNSPDRPAADKSLDAGRKPDQMLAFFGIAPGMKVADLFAGGGYTTELLSRAVGPTGTVYSENGPFPEKFKKIGETWHSRLQKPALKNVVEVDKWVDAPDLFPVAPGTLDAVLINLNYHDLVWLKADRA